MAMMLLLLLIKASNEQYNHEECRVPRVVTWGMAGIFNENNADDGGDVVDDDTTNSSGLIVTLSLWRFITVTSF